MDPWVFLCFSLLLALWSHQCDAGLTVGAGGSQRAVPPVRSPARGRAGPAARAHFQLQDPELQELVLILRVLDVVF